MLAGEGVAHRRMGEVYCDLGRLEEALHHHHRFLEAAEQQQDILEIQRATATVGRTYLVQVRGEGLAATARPTRVITVKLCITYVTYLVLLLFITTVIDMQLFIPGQVCRGQ